MPRGRARDTGSIPFALLLTLVGLSLSAMLVPMVLNQLTSTRVEVRRIGALQAAQAGLDVALGQLRAANNGITDLNGNLGGVAADLPCTALDGVAGTAGSARYRVKVNYFSFNPTPGDYLTAGGTYAESWISANELPCTPASAPTPVPAYALIRAQGTTDPAVSLTGDACQPNVRCLRATYTFRSTNENIPGGLIRVVPLPGKKDLCLDAGAGPWTAEMMGGRDLKVELCAPGNPAQLFAYNKNLTLTLVASKSDALPRGMCLDGRAPLSSVHFHQCLAPSDSLDSRKLQQWAFSSKVAFLGLDGTCFRLSSPDVAGSLVVHDTTRCNATSDTNDSRFTPEASVGAGAADYPTTAQVVNFQQFGRCLDVTGARTTASYLIAWPCKQTMPVDWNQKWVLPPQTVAGPAGADGLITTVTTDNERYCLKSPGSIVAPPAWVTVVSCPVGVAAPAGTTWNVTANTGDYVTSYRIRDSTVGQSYCLAPQTAEAVAADPQAYVVSKIVLQTCSDSTLQKWNAPPNVQDAQPLKNVGER